MKTFCPACERNISYLGETPRFCQHCGSRLPKPADDAPRASSPAPIANPDVQAEPDSGNNTGEGKSPEENTVAPSLPVVKNLPVGEGDVVGPYQVVRLLGSGGMGTVWEAVETKTGRRVALKRLSSSMANDEQYVQRFVREAQLCAKVSHPKVTFIYGSGSDNGQPYIAMELMPGKTLADVIEETGPLAHTYAVDCIIDAAEGLTAAHKIGLIHRDVKPSNCFLDTDDSIKIGDFGLSKSLLGPDLNLTQTGTFMGTPSYSAPEQIRGSELDERTDIYSVGATMFHLLTGRTPFLGDAMTVTAQIVTDDPPLVSEFVPDIPKGLDRIVAKCMAKEPVDRFQTLEELKISLMPFASKRGSVFADIGRRLAAFMIDQTLIWATYSVLVFAIVLIMTMKMQFDGTPSEELQAKLTQDKTLMPLTIGFASMVFLLSLIYFSITEGLFGRSLGKRLMDLRVINHEGQHPGILRALLRSFALPACFGLSLIGVIVYANYYGPPKTAIDNLVFLVTTSGFGLVIAAICLSTMRTSNGLLGLHGLISGTKVIRCQRSKLRIPIVQPKPELLDSMKFGPYESRQSMGESQYGRVFLGHDEPLQRDVWIVERATGAEPELSRINLARVSRQRWLEGGNFEDGRRWDAYEAINGIPIQQFVGMQSKADWSLYRNFMIDIVEELRQAINDNTLPPTLSLALVWLDKDGHAKLLDRHLVNVVSANDTTVAIDKACGTETKKDPVEASVRLVQDLGDLFQRTSVLPASVQDFVIELGRRPRTEETLDWARNKLESLSKNLAGLSWDTRVGIQGATLGVEAVVYLTVSALIFLVCYHVLPIPNRFRFFTGAALSMVLPTVMGFVLQGGLVFRFMGVQVSNLRGRAANGVVTAVRSLISWLPAVAIVGVFILFLMHSEIQLDLAEHGLEPEEGTLQYEIANNPSVIFGITIVLVTSTLSIIGGMVFAILSPKRGFVDFLLRTRLIPK